jgi:midasin (ATPase involved in ribosome maturation)
MLINDTNLMTDAINQIKNDNKDSLERPLEVILEVFFTYQSDKDKTKPKMIGTLYIDKANNSNFTLVEPASGNSILNIDNFLQQSNDVIGSLILSGISFSSTINEIIRDLTFNSYTKTSDITKRVMPKEELIESLLYRGGVNVLLYGRQGVGKSFLSYEIAKKIGKRIVSIQCQNGTQASDLLGYIRPLGSGEFVWQDGELTEAFRLAQQEPIILLIDEMLRLPVKERSVFLSSLSSIDNKHYLLKTSKPILDEFGNYITEEILVPVNNLSVIATTNMGYEYDIEDFDLALSDRFIALTLDNSEYYTKVANDLVATLFSMEEKIDLDNMFNTLLTIANSGDEYREALKPISLRTYKQIKELSNYIPITQMLRNYPELFMKPNADQDIKDKLTEYLTTGRKPKDK